MPLQPDQPAGSNTDTLSHGLPDPDANYAFKDDATRSLPASVTAKQTLVTNWKTNGRGKGRTTN